MVDNSWPELSAGRDRPTIVALHLFSQIVGKVPTALLPWRNHGWHLTLHVTPRGMATEPIHAAEGTFSLSFDLVDHQLIFEDAKGRRILPLGPIAVSEVYLWVTATLADAGYAVKLHPAPNEFEPVIPFAEDREARAYDPDSARRFHRALLAADRVFRLFRSGFLGKVSPVHFFWGGFDLAVTRFSGRPAPLHPGGIPNLPDAITREAYSHEVSSAGFWPGSAGTESEPFFYSYAYPPPDGFAEAKVEPAAARFSGDFGEFALDYESVRTARDPDATLLAFLESTYAAAADLGGWDRAALECALGEPGVPREVLGAPMIAFTPLEIAAMDLIVSFYPEIADALNAQIRTARVTERTNTGGGFFTTIEVSRESAPVDARSPLGNVTADVEQMDYGLGLILFLKDGRINLLEAYAQAPESTIHLNPYELSFTLERTHFVNE